MAVTRMGWGGTLALVITNILVFRYEGGRLTKFAIKIEGEAITRSGFARDIMMYTVYVNVY